MAWARNMGHESPATTFMVYGGFSPDQQFEVIERLGNKTVKTPKSHEEIAKALQLLTNAIKNKEDVDQDT